LAQRSYALAVHYRGSAAAAAETVTSFKDHGVGVVTCQADLSDEQAVRSLIRKVAPAGGAGKSETHDIEAAESIAQLAETGSRPRRPD